jgi:hypothetical protein
MADAEILEIQDRTTTESTATVPPAPPAPVRTGETPLQRAAGLRDVKTLEATDATLDHHEAIVDDLDVRAMVKARKGVPALLDELAGRGFSWRDIARLAGVSVPAVRKWRAGGAHLSERRIDLARAAGLCDLLDEYHVMDPAGWLEMPLLKGVPITWMDMYLAGRKELVVDAASNRRRNVHRLLDEFEPDWREKYSSDFEVFEDIDGKPSIRAKRR